MARYEHLKRRRAASPGELEDRIAAIIGAAGRDKVAAQVLEETVTYLGAGLADLVNLFNPERIVLGGWLGRALSEALLPEIRQAAGRQALRLPFSHVEIVKADLGQDAVALGAATLPIAQLLTAGAMHARSPGSRRRLRRPSPQADRRARRCCHLRSPTHLVPRLTPTLLTS